MITKKHARSIVESLIDTIGEEWGDDHSKSVKAQDRIAIFEFIDGGNDGLHAKTETEEEEQIMGQDLYCSCCGKLKDDDRHLIVAPGFVTKLVQRIEKLEQDKREAENRLASLQVRIDAIEES